MKMRGKRSNEEKGRTGVMGHPHFGLPLLLATFALVTSVVRADLRLEIDNINWRARSGGGYGVFAPDEQSQTIYFRIRSTEAGPYFVTFGNNSSRADGRHKALSQNDELEFIVFDSITRRTPLKELPAANANEVIRGVFGPGESEAELSCVVVVPPRQICGPGNYADTLRVNLYKGTIDQHTLSDSRNLVVSIPVDAVAELSLVKSGEGFDPDATSQKLDFGVLTHGKGRGLDLRVRSNSGYSISIESENRGRLKNINPRDASTLPYDLMIGGRQVDVSTPSKLIQARGATDSNGNRHDLQFTIGNLQGATAGTYRDNITVSVVSDQ